jgi:flagellar protein FlbD
MITLHRLGRSGPAFHVNPDLIVTIEANPDTVITLANGSKLVVTEAPERVAAIVRAYRVEVLSGALGHRRPAVTEDGAMAAVTPLHLAAPEGGR